MKKPYYCDHHPITWEAVGIIIGVLGLIAAIYFAVVGLVFTLSPHTLGVDWVCNFYIAHSKFENEGWQCINQADRDLRINNFKTRMTD